MLRLIKSLVIVGSALSVALLGMSGSALATGGEQKAADSVNVVYHVNDTDNAVDALRNAANHLDADPKVKITFVTHSKGIDFLLAGATDKSGNPYNIAVEKLMDRGVTFDVCNVTLARRKIDSKSLLEGVKLVPSGVAEVARLQAKEGFAYVKP